MSEMLKRLSRFAAAVLLYLVLLPIHLIFVAVLACASAILGFLMWQLLDWALPQAGMSADLAPLWAGALGLLFLVTGLHEYFVRWRGGPRP